MNVGKLTKNITVSSSNDFISIRGKPTAPYTKIVWIPAQVFSSSRRIGEVYGYLLRGRVEGTCHVEDRSLPRVRWLSNARAHAHYRWINHTRVCLSKALLFEGASPHNLLSGLKWESVIVQRPIPPLIVLITFIVEVWPLGWEWARRRLGLKGVILTGGAVVS